MGNTSTQDETDVIPLEIKGWNWGAFLLPVIWGLSHRVPILTLCFTPFLAFVLGANGNKWAWQNRKWDNIEHFQRTQERWALAGLTVNLLLIIIIGLFILFVVSPS